jgi:EAL domain-containing protein (putative c-di-GMP-specific phosphodiesterase class I)
MKLHEENVIPYFQPILCADTCSVSGYEVLGRYIDANGNVISLGDFFHDPATSADYALYIDRIIRRKAMQRYAEEGCNKDIFINMRLEWLTSIDLPHEIYTLQCADEFGISPEHLVIEITEEEFNINKNFLKVITFYYDVGCRVALDDYGKNASNIDRLAHISPDIIKINLDYIQKSAESFHHRAYIYSLSSFADFVGIEILCEGIETQAQLDVCMETRSRYFQGFLLGVPQPVMLTTDTDCDTFLQSSGKIISSLDNRMIYTNALQRSLDMIEQNFIAENIFVLGKTDIDPYLINLMRTLPEHVMRLFLCERKGRQISGNIERCAGDIVVATAPGANWGWRGFFHEAARLFESGHRSGVTGAYRDVKTKERIFTHFNALHSDLFLFADVKRVPLNFP